MVSKTFNIYISYDRKLSGTIIMGHPNPGLKRPQHTQMGFGTRAGSLFNSDSRSFFRYGRPKSPSAHGPASHHGSLEALLAVGQPPPRSRVLRREPSKHRQSPPRSRPPPLSPPQGLGAGEAPPRSRPPSAGGGCGPATRRDGAHLLVNHSMAWGGCQAASAGVHHTAQRT